MEILKKEDLEAYKAFVQKNPKGHFMQGPEWAKVKNNWKWEAVVEKDASGEIVGGMSVLIRRVPGLPFTFLYAPRGPVCDVSDTNMMARLVGGVRALAVKYHAYLFRIDPDITVKNVDFDAALKKMGFELRAKSKNFDGIQPSFVFRLNVEGKSEDELMASFQSKTRYNIRLSVRHGVEVKIRDKGYLDEFIPIMQETGNRDGFATRPKEYFERMLDAFGEHARLYMAYYDNKPVAGTVAIWYGDKVWYLYGASSGKYRNIMPNYLLQWEMIKWSVEKKCRVYDFRGVSGDLSPENPLYGLYRFKKGFNGDLTEFLGEYDLVFNRAAEAVVNAGVRLDRMYLSMKNRRHKA